MNRFLNRISLVLFYKREIEDGNDMILLIDMMMMMMMMTMNIVMNRNGPYVIRLRGGGDTSSYS
jgi:hypothetical protein